MTIGQFIKANAGTISGIITLIGSIGGGVLFFEARYAKASDITQMRLEQRQQTQQIQVETARSVDNLRKQQLEDKLFELRTQQGNSTNRALIRRYEEQLQEVTTRVNR